MSREITEEKFPWILVIATTVIFTVLGNIWLALLPHFNLVVNYNLGYVGCALSLSPLGFLPFLIMLPLKTKLGSRTATVLYTVGLTTGFFMNLYFPWYQPGAEFTSRYINPENSIRYIPSFVAPPREVAENLLYGNPYIPWSDWLVPVMFWWVYQVVFSLFMISTVSIFRQFWIDVEKMPFPQTAMAYEIVRMTVEREKYKRLSKPFIIGLILGLVIQVPIFMALTFPWFPDIYAWRTNTCGFGSTWVTPDSPLATVVGFQLFNKWPPFAAVFYLAPLSVLTSFMLWFLVYLIASQVAYYMGYYTGILDLPGCGRNWCGANVPTAGDPFKWAALSNIGGLIGLTLFYMVLNRRYIFSTIKTAFTKVREVDESKEPISYRAAYLLFITSFIAVTALYTVLGMSITVALLMPIIAFIAWIASLRIFGLIGFNAVTYGGYGTGFVWLIWPVRPEPPTQEWFWAMLMNRTFLTDGFGYGWPGVMTAAFSGFKMSSLTGTSNKLIFKTLIVSSIIAPLTAVITMIWLCYSFGGMKFATFITDVNTDIVARFINPGAHENWPAAQPWVAHAIAGIVIVGILSYLHTRFLWFPMGPIGFLMATTGHTLLEGVWTMGLVAWIAKTLTLRIGGSKAYEEYGVPLVSGVIAGTIVAIFIGGLIGVVRFFVPF